jgi:glucosamine--fructose-6-phosphate aminotransferase (isomerizing)
VKWLGNFPDRFLAEIAGQPAAIRRASAAMAEQAPLLDELSRHTQAAPAVVFTGMGSSYDACYAPVTLLAGAGIATTMVDAAELLHHRLPAVTADTLVIAVSQSGESAELVRLAEELTARERPPVLVSVTNGLENPLARAASLAVDTRAGEEYGPSTMTFAATLVALQSVAEALGCPAADGAEAAATAVERLLEDAEQQAQELGDWLGERTSLHLLARGCARPAAEMGALTLKEAARLPAESLQTAQFRHGPLELAGPEQAAIVMAAEPATRAFDLRLAAELAEAGSAVVVVSPDGEAPAGAMGVATGEVSRGLVSTAAIVPVQLLTWRLANLRGLAPGEYTQASKVTTRE